MAMASNQTAQNSMQARRSHIVIELWVSPACKSSVVTTAMCLTILVLIKLTSNTEQIRVIGLALLLCAVETSGGAADSTTCSRVLCQWVWVGSGCVRGPTRKVLRLTLLRSIARASQTEVLKSSWSSNLLLVFIQLSSWTTIFHFRIIKGKPHDDGDDLVSDREEVLRTSRAKITAVALRLLPKHWYLKLSSTQRIGVCSHS